MSGTSRATESELADGAALRFYDSLWATTKRVDQHHKCRMHALEKMLRLIHLPSAQRARILELGCGSGIVSEFLSQYGNVTGVDQSSVGVEQAKARVRGTFIIGTLPDIPVPDSDFDLCVLSQVIEHLADGDQIAVLENARAKVASGGHLLITTPNRPVSSQMRFGRGELQPIENWLDVAGVERLLSRTGWKVVKVCYAFSLLPVLISRQAWLRPIRYLTYDLLRMRNIIEDSVDSRGWGDTIATFAIKA